MNYLFRIICCAALVGTTYVHAADSLKSAAADYFEIGVGISDRIPDRPADWPLLLRHFAGVTPENCLKPNPVQVEEGKFRFELAGSFRGVCGSNHLRVVGHCLVWAKDDRTPPWFFLDGTNPVSKEVLLQRMKTHIETVAGRYRGRMAMWDVVNEALDDGTNFLRPSGWVSACGEEFLVKAFEYAHGADPKALLIYNDYNNELPGKREKLIRLVKMLQERKAPVHAIGLQGHYELGKVPLKDIEDTLLAMKELGMKVVVSELDIDVVLRSKWWADGGKHRRNSPNTILTREIARRKSCGNRRRTMPKSLRCFANTAPPSSAFPSGTCTTAIAG